MNASITSKGQLEARGYWTVAVIFQMSVLTLVCCFHVLVPLFTEVVFVQDWPQALRAAAKMFQHWYDCLYFD